MESRPESRSLFGWTRYRVYATCFVCSLLAALLVGCGGVDRSTSSPYFADVVTPSGKKEFRWSNGRLPRSFDPALAAAPPETDVLRAVYEGLTATDPRTLEALPAVAEKWSSSENDRVWRFHLRGDAVWSNGKPVTASDFVRAWNRLASLGTRNARPELLKNFSRARSAKPVKPDTTPSPTPWSSDEPPPLIPKTSTSPDITAKSPPAGTADLDVHAEGELVLIVRLDTPDPDLPKLVANPLFSPVHGDGSEFTSPEPANAIVSNGPYRLALVTKESVVLDKSDTYRNKDAIEIDTVRFVAVESASDALEAYRTGQVDLVTNAEFEPLALKVLSPYQDFRKVTHGALNLYEFNVARPPFNDRRVREALTIAIEREMLTEGEMGGATRAALRYLPLGGGQVKELVQDVARARTLLADAGYPNGEGFPAVRLVVNRNDAQQRIARAVARMWENNLGIRTEIVPRELAEIPDVRRAKDYDIIRRGVVFATSDARSNLSAIFDPPEDAKSSPEQPGVQSSSNSNSVRAPGANSDLSSSTTPDIAVRPRRVPSEQEALYELTVIPLYFPASYALVKPYVQGFEPNALDIISLQNITIDNNWQPRPPAGES